MTVDKLVLYLEALVGLLAGGAGTLALAWLRRLNTTAVRAKHRSDNNRTAIRRILEHLKREDILDHILEDYPEGE